MLKNSDLPMEGDELGIRLFHCKCNHKLRFGKATCSYCFRPTPIYNRWWSPLLLVLIGAGVYVLLTANGATG